MQLLTQLGPALSLDPKLGNTRPEVDGWRTIVEARDFRDPIERCDE
jgi:hypothetical protein